MKNWKEIEKRFYDQFVFEKNPYRGRPRMRTFYEDATPEKVLSYFRHEIDTAYKKGQMDAAGNIGFTASQAGVDIIDLDSSKDWNRAVRKIQQ